MCLFHYINSEGKQQKNQIKAKKQKNAPQTQLQAEYTTTTTYILKFFTVSLAPPRDNG